MINSQELARRYFEQFNYLAKKKITPQTFRDAVAAAGTIADFPSDFIDFVIAHAESRGIDPQKDLTDLADAQADAKKTAVERARDADLKAGFVKMLETLNAAVEETAEPETRTAALFSINESAAELTAAAAPVSRFPKWAEYESAWQKDSDTDFAPALFNRLAFPDGTVSYIGARTGRGKTTALVNIGVSALFSDSFKKQPRRVLFISLEENQKQILRRFSLCLAYKDADAATRDALISVTNPHTGAKDPKNAYKNWKRGKDIGGDGAQAFVTAITKSDALLKKSVETGRLIFFDGIGAGLYEILSTIRSCRQGDVVLLDYIQKIPAREQIYGGNPDLERIRQGSESLIEAAQSAECVVIAGAQFNREGAKGKADDTFTDADFRGCGDLEQDGHNLIGIGRSGDKKTHYYGIIKSREGELSDTLSTLDFAGGYSFMGYEGNEFKPVRRERRKASEEIPGKKLTKVYNPDGTFREVDFSGEPEPL